MITDPYIYDFTACPIKRRISQFIQQSACWTPEGAKQHSGFAFVAMVLSGTFHNVEMYMKYAYQASLRVASLAFRSKAVKGWNLPLLMAVT